MYKIQYKVPVDNEGNWGWATRPRVYPTAASADRTLSHMRRMGLTARVVPIDSIG